MKITSSRISLENLLQSFVLLSIMFLFVDRLHAASSWDGKTPVDYVLSVATDRTDAIYHQGDKVTFNIALEHNNQPATDGTVEWTISKDCVAPVQTGSTALNGGKGSITGTLNEPGFLHCEVAFRSGTTKFTALAGAAIDPQKIKPSLSVPDDFDVFWAAKKKELASVPMNAKLTPVPLPPGSSEAATADVFELQIDSIGAPCCGYFGRPKEAKPKSLPAVLYVPGQGVRSADMFGLTNWGKDGVLCIEMNAHGIPDGKPKEFYAALDAGELKDYRTRGRESRDTYYFLGVFYRVIRALDFLTSQPEWDGKTLVIVGISQGGGLSLVGAGLDPRVTYVIAGVPGLADHSGMQAGRIAGWPKVIPNGADGKPDPKVLETMRYFDAANFATRAKARGYFEVGFVDVIYPPTCGYVAYNNFAGEKEIVNHPNNGHNLGTEFWERVRKLVLAHIAEQAKTKTTTGNP